MARIWTISDIHDDINRRAIGHSLRLPRGIDADLLVIAGDIGGRLSRGGLAWILAQEIDLPILIAAGNHDFYDSSLDTEIGRFRDRNSRSDIHVLDGESIEIAGTRFIGATLWTDYGIRHPDGQHTAMLEAMRQGMNDFRYIRDRSYEWGLTPGRLYEEHLRQRTAIERILAEPFDGPTAIITHHAPSAQSLQHGRTTSYLDGSYASDLEGLILQHRPDLWIHGHVHRRRDYWIGDTHIIANPRGYSDRPEPRRILEWERTDFDPRLIIGTGNDRRLHGLSGAAIEHTYDRPGLSGPLPLATTDGLDADLAAEVEARRTGGAL